MDNQTRLERWRLILGAESQNRFAGMGAAPLAGQADLMDQALAAIYNPEGDAAGTNGSGGGSGTGYGLRGGRGPSSPRITRWLGDVRSLFDRDLVKVLQGDAMTRCGLTQMLFEPEILENLEPDLNLAATLLTLKDQVPERSRESVREYIRKIVAEINKLLEQDLRRSVTAAVNRRAHSPIPSAAALDYKRTIERNLKHYDPHLRRLVPEHFYFFERAATSAANKWTVILDVDQSGSMGESVLYSSVMACILASMASLRTRIVAFDTSIVDLTERCSDPVDLLFGFQLGGGTDINRSVAYCSTLIDNPRKTLFFLITDLEEGGNQAELLQRLKDLKDSGVTAVCLLAISDSGKPWYNAALAQRVASLEIPCFACSPAMLPQMLGRALRGQDLAAFQKEFEARKPR